MKEFIETLIGRLEKQKTIYREIRKNTYCRRTEMDDCDSCRADHYLDARIEGINKAQQIVNQLAEEMNLSENLTSSDGWIPVSERLPEEAGVYEVTKEVFINSTKQYIVEHRLFGTEGEWLCPSNRKVIAWKPLPEPYKKGSETDE